MWLIDNKSINIGIHLPSRGILIDDKSKPIDVSRLFSLAETAEKHGYDSLWVGDSLTAKPRLEPLTTLSAVASRTKNIKLGTSVLLAALRHPLLLAQTSATLDVISGGRLLLAMGVGGAFTETLRKEWMAVGIDPAQRTERLEESISVLRGLWTTQNFSHKGKHFRFENISFEPKPVKKSGIPILLACHGRSNLEAQFQRAAKLGDGYISITDTPQEYAYAREKVLHYAEQFGKDPDLITSTFYMTINIDVDEKRAAKEANEFLLKYYGFNHWGDRWGPFGHPEKVLSKIADYVNAGAETIVIRFASFNPNEQLERLTENIKRL